MAIEDGITDTLSHSDTLWEGDRKGPAGVGSMVEGGGLAAAASAWEGALTRSWTAASGGGGGWSQLPAPGRQDPFSLRGHLGSGFHSGTSGGIASPLWALVASSVK